MKLNFLGFLLLFIPLFASAGIPNEKEDAAYTIVNDISEFLKTKIEENSLQYTIPKFNKSDFSNKYVQKYKNVGQWGFPDLVIELNGRPAVTVFLADVDSQPSLGKSIGTNPITWRKYSFNVFVESPDKSVQDIFVSILSKYAVKTKQSFWEKTQ